MRIFFIYKNFVYLFIMGNDFEKIPEGFYKDLSGNIVKKTCSCGKTNEQIDSCACNQPKGMLGWICPVCGRGNSPFNSSCPCVAFDSFPRWQITCGHQQSSNTQQ